MSRLSMSANHVYWLADPHGKKHRVPSVSALKKTLFAFDNPRWVLGQAADAITGDWDRIHDLAPVARRDAALDVAWTHSRAAMEHGRAIHACAEQLWTGEPVDVPADYAPHVQAVADHFHHTGAQVVTAEQMGYSDAGEYGQCAYAGTIDLVIKQPGRGVGIVDLKTWMPGSSGQPRQAEWLFQLAAYRQLQHWSHPDDDQPAPDIKWVGVWHVGPDGLREYVATPAELRKAEDLVDAARALKDLPHPTMKEQP